MKRFWKALIAAGKGFSSDDCPSMAAAIAYFTIFALPMALVLVVAVAAFIFGEKAAQGHLADQIAGFVGEKGAEQIQAMIAHAAISGSKGWVATAISVAVLLFSASSVFAYIQKSLNKAWQVAPDPEQSGIVHFIVYFLLTRLVSLLMVLTMGILLLLSLAASAFMAAFGRIITEWLPAGMGSALLETANQTISFTIFTLFFAAIYKVIPDAKVSWKDVWAGAAFAALLTVAGKFALGFYLGRSQVGSIYGAAGSLVIVLTWIYYSACILLMGAEFTQGWACYSGKEIAPKKGAVRVSRQISRSSDAKA